MLLLASWFLLYLWCNMPICYTKRVVIEQNNIQFLIIVMLCTSHKDPFGHILHQKPSRQVKQISAVFKQEPENGGFWNIFLIYMFQWNEFLCLLRIKLWWKSCLPIELNTENSFRNNLFDNIYWTNGHLPLYCTLEHLKLLMFLLAACKLCFFFPMAVTWNSSEWILIKGWKNR